MEGRRKIAPWRTEAGLLHDDRLLEFEDEQERKKRKKVATPDESEARKFPRKSRLTQLVMDVKEAGWAPCDQNLLPRFLGAHVTEPLVRKFGRKWSPAQIYDRVLPPDAWTQIVDFTNDEHKRRVRLHALLRNDCMVRRTLAMDNLALTSSLRYRKQT